MSKGLKAPVGTGGVSFIGALLAIAVTALGVIAIREALIAWDLISGELWIAESVSGDYSITVNAWLLALAIVAALIGLYLVAVSLKPLPKRAIALDSETGIFVPTNALNAIAVNAAEDIDGVMSASASATRNKVRVRATTTNATDDLKNQVRNAVESRFTAIGSKLNVVVSVKQKGAEE